METYRVVVERTITAEVIIEAAGKDQAEDWAIEEAESLRVERSAENTERLKNWRAGEAKTLTINEIDAE